MSKFKTKFNPTHMGHRFKMLQLMNGLALEINTTIKVGKRSLVTFAKEIGYLDKSFLVRQKREALRELVGQAKAGFGYVPNPSVLRALPPVVLQEKKRKPRQKVAV